MWVVNIALSLTSWYSLLTSIPTAGSCSSLKKPIMQGKEPHTGSLSLFCSQNIFICPWLEKLWESKLILSRIKEETKLSPGLDSKSTSETITLSLDFATESETTVQSIPYLQRHINVWWCSLVMVTFFGIRMKKVFPQTSEPKRRQLWSTASTSPKKYLYTFLYRSFVCLKSWEIQIHKTDSSRFLLEKTAYRESLSYTYSSILYLLYWYHGRSKI